MSTYVPRIAKKYKDEVVPYLLKKFGYKNIHQVPKLVKISLNMGVGDAVQDSKNRRLPLQSRGGGDLLGQQIAGGDLLAKRRRRG